MSLFFCVCMFLGCAFSQGVTLCSKTTGNTQCVFLDISDKSSASLRVINYLSFAHFASQLGFSLNFCVVAGKCNGAAQH